MLQTPESTNRDDSWDVNKLSDNYSPGSKVGINALFLAVNRELVPSNVRQIGSPVELGRINAWFLDGIFFLKFQQHVLFRGNKVYTVDDLQDAKLVQSVYDIIGHDGGSFRNIHDTEARFIRLIQ